MLDGLRVASTRDVGVAIAFGLMGLLLRANGYPVIPLILGLILGPLAEENLLRSLELGHNSLGYFLGSPTAVVLWLVLIAAIAYLIRQSRARRRLDPERTNVDSPAGR